MATTTKPAIELTFRTGEINPVTRKYACLKCDLAGGRRIITLPKGAPFPKCDQSHDNVWWRLEGDE